jgi:hypothetical protein
MKENFSNKIELAANLCIILVALLGICALAKYLINNKTNTNNNVPISNKQLADNLKQFVPALGTKISLPGVNWATGQETLLLILSTTCKTCSESAPFYRRIVHEAQRKHTPYVMAVFPQQIDDGKKYLEGIDVPLNKIVHSDIRAIGVWITPALIHIDETGTVKHVWPGRLSSDTESNVLSVVGL